MTRQAQKRFEVLIGGMTAASTGNLEVEFSSDSEKEARAFFKNQTQHDFKKDGYISKIAYVEIELYDTWQGEILELEKVDLSDLKEENFIIVYKDIFGDNYFYNENEGWKKHTECATIYDDEEEAQDVADTLDREKNESITVEKFLTGL